MIAFFNGCQEALVDTNQSTISNEILEKTVDSKLPDTYVHGYVTLNSNPYSDAKVELWEGGNLLTYTYSASDGLYNICVCCQHQGTGYYTVKTAVYIHGELWSATSHFYFNDAVGPFDFEINLPLALTIEKNI